MKKSQFVLITQLKEKLMLFPSIVSKLEKKDPFFVETIVEWLKSSEDIFSTYNISAVSELAGFRSKIIATRTNDTRGTNIRKNQTKVAANILYDIQSTVLTVLMPFEKKMDECRELVKQLLALLLQKGTETYHPETSFEAFVRTIWYTMLSDHELKMGAIKLKSILSETDIVMLIGDEIEIEEFS
ncbi:MULTISPECIES: hypothetical protein [unclassified Chryseobacterium]|uniref:hypothetical protein n=1 Tax=unclassified Chryseobacterium TaxID=2593645 RepID=UPI002269E51A|nr:MULTISPECIES: hypothetical protein [unclassified Chryseobacterium]